MLLLLLLLLLLHLHVNADSKSGKVSPVSKLTLIKDIASLQQSEDVSKFTGADIDGWPAGSFGIR
jgi:hypothetical protein